MFDRKRLVGAWQLARWWITYGDGSVTEPLGPDAQGLLIYTDDGWMSAAMMARDRSCLARRNPRAAPVGQRAAAFDTFFAYSGRWRVMDRTVEHHVTLAHNPALVGTVQVRRILMRGRQLILSAEEPTARGIRVHRLQWRRAAPVATPRRRQAKPAAAVIPGTHT